MLTLQELEDAVATMLRQLDDDTNQTLRVKRRLLQATLEERERCALVAAIHSQYPVTTDYDRGYAKARADVAAAIRKGE